MLRGKVVPKLRRTGVKLHGSGLAMGLFLQCLSADSI